MQTVSSALMREIDRRTIVEGGVPGVLLMERAGAGLARAAEKTIAMRRPERAPADTVILLVAGHGNNGGDVFVAARHLHARGYRTEVRLTAAPQRVQGDARIQFDRMLCAGITPRVMPAPDDWRSEAMAEADTATPPMIVVDGIMGTGINGAPRGTAAAAIEYINRLRGPAMVISVDVPSGLDADSGQAAGAVITADQTLTMGLPKTGLLQPSAHAFTGSLQVVDIGIPRRFYPPADASPQLITGHESGAVLRPRARAAHKGDYGHLLIVGGSSGFAGAVILAARAALRAGTGLVSLLVPAAIRAEIAGAVPEAMAHGAPADEHGGFGICDPERWTGPQSRITAILAGPGIGTRPAAAALLKRILENAGRPLVLDADALNLLAAHPELLPAWRDRQQRPPLILTPHPGEAARLLRVDTAAVQSDRRGAAQRLAATTGATIVLKGAGTLLAQTGRPLLVNLSGNPGMAVGGSGDVLAGLLAGLAAGNIAAIDAARLAVYWHGRAGDHAAWRFTETAMTAGDIIDRLPEAAAELNLP